MKYNTLAVDLDHTLLNSYGRISRNSFKALKEFFVLNGQIIISTGRWPISALIFNRQIVNYIGKQNNYLIALNGAVVYDFKKNKFVYEKNIEDNIFKQLFNFVKAKKVPLWFFSKKGIDEKVIFTYKTPFKKLIGMFNYGKLKKFNFDKYFFNNDILKIIILSFSKKKIKKTAYFLEQNFSDNLFISKTSSYLIEINAKDVNKGSAIKFLSQYGAFDLNRTVAMGDSNNDIPIFKEVGLKIALNPSSELEKISDFCVYGKDRFSYALKKHVILNDANLLNKEIIIDISNIPLDILFSYNEVVVNIFKKLNILKCKVSLYCEYNIDNCIIISKLWLYRDFFRIYFFNNRLIYDFKNKVFIRDDAFSSEELKKYANNNCLFFSKNKIYVKHFNIKNDKIKIYDSKSKIYTQDHFIMINDINNINEEIYKIKNIDEDNNNYLLDFGFIKHDFVFISTNNVMTQNLIKITNANFFYKELIFIINDIINQNI